MNISVFGLGKLGACFAVAAASRGHHVIGVDVNLKIVKMVNDGISHLDEINYQSYLSGAHGTGLLKATSSAEHAVLNSQYSFIIVPTPSDSMGCFSTDLCENVIDEIGKVLAKKDGWHNVILVSTVLPGACRHRLLIRLVHACPTKKLGAHYGFCYSPEFIALGSVIANMQNPDMVLIGESNKKSGDDLLKFYREFFHNCPSYHRMSLENAELTKVAVNTFLTAKIDFANMLARICEAMPGGDVDVVTDALGSDSRIGPRLLRGGLGFGGPCLPRDNKALAWIMHRLEVDASLPGVIGDYNYRVPRDTLMLMKDVLPKFPVPQLRALVLGLTYKPDTPVTEASQGIQIANQLAYSGFDTHVYEPLGYALTEGLERDISRSAVFEPELKQADVVFVCTMDERWKAIMPDHFKPGAVVVDCWRILNEQVRCFRGIKYVAVGRGYEVHRQSRLRKVWTDEQRS